METMRKALIDIYCDPESIPLAIIFYARSNSSPKNINDQEDCFGNRHSGGGKEVSARVFRGKYEKMEKKGTNVRKGEETGKLEAYTVN
jgi:hypothetical protein